MVARRAGEHLAAPAFKLAVNLFVIAATPSTAKELVVVQRCARGAFKSDVCVADAATKLSIDKRASGL